MSVNMLYQTVQILVTFFYSLVQQITQKVVVVKLKFRIFNQHLNEVFPIGMSLHNSINIYSISSVWKWFAPS